MAFTIVCVSVLVIGSFFLYFSNKRDEIWRRTIEERGRFRRAEECRVMRELAKFKLALVVEEQEDAEFQVEGWLFDFLRDHGLTVCDLSLTQKHRILNGVFTDFPADVLLSVKVFGEEEDSEYNTFLEIKLYRIVGVSETFLNGCTVLYERRFFLEFIMNFLRKPLLGEENSLRLVG
ncbi:MAG: hypothetical protein Q8O32_01500 [bacterium]|nr:hypothetical protein [bacterium]